MFALISTFEDLKEEIAQFKAAFQSQKRDLEKMKSTLEASMNANLALKKELDATKKKLKDEIEESKRLSEELDDLEQYTRKNSLEIHGVPANAYTSTEEVFFKARRSRLKRRTSRFRTS